ncbi:MAG: FtsX-like permease family protein [Massilia sp.]|nr:FtsX-like permease family protein [Massilia sp.]
MSPQRLALRTLMLRQPRSMMAIALVAACLCLINLVAGALACERTRLAYQAVSGERLGHLSITPAGAASGHGFAPPDAQRIARLAEAMPGVALVQPRMRVRGIAATGARSALFDGEGVSAAEHGTDHGTDAEPGAQGRLDPAQPNGIAMSDGSARALGLHAGATLTLLGVGGAAPAARLEAKVVDIFATTGFNAHARTLLMPFNMAQALLGTGRTERLALFLSDPQQLDNAAATLPAALRAAGLAAEVRAWPALSAGDKQARSAADLIFASLAGIAFAVIGAAIAATVSINAFERRREVATLRALGMRRGDVFLMVSFEAVWMALFAVLISLAGSALITSLVNRVALSLSTRQALNRAPMLIELDVNRMAMVVLLVMVVALLAALAPAWRAARADVAAGLAA